MLELNREPEPVPVLAAPVPVPKLDALGTPDPVPMEDPAECSLADRPKGIIITRKPNTCNRGARRGDKEKGRRGRREGEGEWSVVEK